MPHLILVEKGSGKIHQVDGDVLVGRDPACGIALHGNAAMTVSGRHARLFLDDGRWWVEDAGSRNGTYVGTRRLEPGARHPLAIGDIIGLGMTGPQFAVRDVAARSLAATIAELSPPVAAPTRAEWLPSAEPLPPSEASSPHAPPPGDALRSSSTDVRQVPQIRVRLRPRSGAVILGRAERVTIGRALESVVRVTGDSATSVSRMHAEIVIVGGQPTIADGGSRHGTFLNGERIASPSPLAIGDVIMLGPAGPSFTVEELAVGAPGSAAEHASATRDADGVFHAELPTPALGQAAIRVPAHETAGARDTAVRATPRRRRAEPLRVAAWGAVALAIVITAAISYVAGRSSSNPTGSGRAAGVPAGDYVDPDDRPARLREAERKATQAKSSLDSAAGAGAPAAVLDSLRATLDSAQRSAAALRAGRP